MGDWVEPVVLAVETCHATPDAVLVETYRQTIETQKAIISGLFRSVRRVSTEQRLQSAANEMELKQLRKEALKYSRKRRRKLLHWDAVGVEPK